VGAIGNLRNWWRELRTLNRLAGMPRDERRIVIYSEDTFSYIHFERLADELMHRHGRRLVYLTSAPADPLLARSDPQMAVYYLNRLTPGYVARLDSEVFLTTMPDLGKLHIQRPGKDTRCVYVFHSLNSTHMVYRQGAFDHYDVILCTSPHQVRELTAHFQSIGQPVPALHEVGYYKLERIHAAHRAYVKQHPERRTVLLAPTWGKGNFLEAAGFEITERLLAAGYRVIVRPHPCFFLPIYPGGLDVVRRIEKLGASNPDFLLEKSIDSEDSFHEADLMVCDWSGAAYEYAFGTERPVLFIDVPRKAFNPDWQKIGMVPFEDRMRREVGLLVPTSDVPQIAGRVGEMLAASEEYRQKLCALRAENVYNFGSSSQVAARIIDQLLADAAPRENAA
jgi:YidC/Oxa1 family membrane protein insertase